MFLIDQPPVLFEVYCSQNSIQIGGFPWHYIYTPLHKNHKGTHHICSLKDSTLVGFWTFVRTCIFFFGSRDENALHTFRYTCRIDACCLIHLTTVKLSRSDSMCVGAKGYICWCQVTGLEVEALLNLRQIICLHNLLTCSDLWLWSCRKKSDSY